jgi:hypothetical protein
MKLKEKKTKKESTEKKKKKISFRYSSMFGNVV